MIIVANAAGQLCNRILLLAHSYATGIETNQRIYVLYWSDLKKFFEPVSNDKNIKFLKINREWFITQEKIQAKFWGPNFREIGKDKQEQKKEKIYSGGGMHLINCWYYRDYSALFKHRDLILKLFMPTDQCQKDITRYINKINVSGRLNVGVHIRRGDYKTWHRGKYFFSDMEYKRWMMLLAKKCEIRIQFVLFSNESVDISVFHDNFYDVCLGPGSQITDLYSMSKCDYIMGPPSTYSWWAAFYGNKPYLTLRDREQSIDFEMFSMVKGEEFAPDVDS